MNNFLGNYNISILIPEEREILNRLVIIKFSQSSHSCPPPTKRKHRKGIKLKQFHGKILLALQNVGAVATVAPSWSVQKGESFWKEHCIDSSHFEDPTWVVCVHVHTCAKIADQSRRAPHSRTWKEIGHQNTAHVGSVLLEGCWVVFRILNYSISSLHWLKSNTQY